MSEKITSSQIYLFLANRKDWQTEADSNHNGEIVKGEMREYLSGVEFENWSGVSIKDVSAKVFNEFWASIDANVNNNKLDEQELNRTMVQIEAVKEVKNFVDKKASDIPSGLQNYSDLWNDELTNALNETILNYIKGISLSQTEITDEMKSQINTLLENAYAQAKTTAAVQCYIQKYTDENAGNSEVKALKEYGYLITDDKDLERIIKNWMSQNQETDTAKIGEAVKNLIEGYLATAKIGNGDVSALDGNSGYNASKLNELQMAKLKKEAQGVFGSSLKDIDLGFTIEGANGAIDLKGGGYDGIYKKYVDEFLKSYFESGYKNATRSNGQSLFEAALNELKTNGMQLFKNNKAGENFITEVQFADNYKFAWEGKDFFKEVVATGIDGIGEDGSIIEGSDLANLKTWLNNDCGEGKFPEYYAAYNKILQAIMNPYDSTYRKSDGSINYDKINTELIDVVKTKFGIISKTTSTNEDGTKTTINNKIDWSTLTDNNYSYSSYVVSYNDGGANSKVNHNSQVSANMSYYYSCGGRINLLGTLKCDNNDGFTANKTYDWLTAISTAKSNFSGFIDSLKGACAASGQYDSAALEIAANKVKALYNMAFDGAPNNWAGKKSTNAPDENGNGGPSFVYDGESYNYGIKKWYEEDTACAERHEGGKLGLVFAEAYKKTTSQTTVDLKTVMDMFAKFYEAAVKS